MKMVNLVSIAECIHMKEAIDVISLHPEVVTPETTYPISAPILS